MLDKTKPSASVILCQLNLRKRYESIHMHTTHFIQFTGRIWYYTANGINSCIEFVLLLQCLTLNMIRGCEIRLIVLYFFMRRKLPFLDSDVAILSIKLFTTLTRFSFWRRHPYFRGKKFSRKVHLKYFREKIFSRIYCSRENIFPRKYLPAKITSRENIFSRKYLPANFFRAANIDYVG